ncbi:hypothetical protein H0H87_005047 [Tephrocybe sp. NHM501043]|nr:hypothetical protein H0H87_005047 [Tephrocybe sp. NHM501043]
MASSEGGSTDPLKNLHLAAVLKRAKDMDVPKENIEKALAKASRGKDQNGDTFVYEALAFNSVGLIIARQAPVKFMFKRMGYVTVSPADNSAGQDSQDELVETALTNGAIDFDSIVNSPESGVSSFWFTCEPDTLLSLTSAISQQFSKSWNVGISEVRYMPLEETSDISTEDKNELKELVNELEDNEDVLQVWTSAQDDR